MWSLRRCSDSAVWIVLFQTQRRAATAGLGVRGADIVAEEGATYKENVKKTLFARYNETDWRSWWPWWWDGLNLAPLPACFLQLCLDCVLVVYSYFIFYCFVGGHYHFIFTSLVHFGWLIGWPQRSCMFKFSLDPPVVNKCAVLFAHSMWTYWPWKAAFNVPGQRPFEIRKWNYKLEECEHVCWWR